MSVTNCKLFSTQQRKTSRRERGGLDSRRHTVPAALQPGTPPRTAQLSGALQAWWPVTSEVQRMKAWAVCSVPCPPRAAWCSGLGLCSPIAGGCRGQRVEGALQTDFGNGPSHPQLLEINQFYHRAAAESPFPRPAVPLSRVLALLRPEILKPGL